MEVVVLDYGAGNVRSVVFALQRLGISARLSNDPQVISNADYIIFPGQGAAAMAMNKLNLSGLTAVLPNLKQPILGICLGMQLLLDESKEFGNLRPENSKTSALSLILNFEGIFWFNIFQSKYVDAEKYIDEISNYILYAYTQKGDK